MRPTCPAWFLGVQGAGLWGFAALPLPCRGDLCCRGLFDARIVLGFHQGGHHLAVNYVACCSNVAPPKRHFDLADLQAWSEAVSAGNP